MKRKIKKMKLKISFKGFTKGLNENCPELDTKYIFKVNMVCFACNLEGGSNIGKDKIFSFKL